ncbi:putative external nadh-ubiquinone oxidoreductase mitochondrial precursor [Diplodia seriata]|uniref:Putative external nadh-ubiquinone oxidoreductase mitochondrial n=1 Tax=Diplodia seriata TaxID=420778 RepID=A0A0G2GTA9_9PEZI|nr:putative external nadh-ubiquinone oxidoreductase mitochondrial precursor [Diplodia seriata]
MERELTKYQPVVVSPRSYFVFTPLLASTSTGTLEFRTALEPVRSKRTDVAYFQGWADAVDFKNKTVSIEEAVEDPQQGLALTGDRHEGESPAERRAEKVEESKKGQLFNIKYDKLVVSVGCYSQTFGTPGVRENALFLKDVGDARKIRNRLLACFETAALPTTSEEMRKYLLNFAIVGGGPTGIEFSAELHDIIREDLSKLYPDLMKYYKITVYDVAPRVLSMFDEKLGKYAMKTFKREGIDIKTSHHVQELRRGGQGEDGKSRAILEDVYALGDCGTIENTAYPATAQVANQKAVWLAKRLNHGDIESQSFTWKNMGVMAYIGNWRAVMQTGGGGNISGRAAWLIWRGAYLTKAVSWRNKVLIPVYWFINWVFGRDVSRF